MSEVVDIAPKYGDDTLQDRVSGVVFALMAVKRMSQKELAYQLEIAASTLSQKLNGHSRWTIDELAELGGVFNVNPQIFLKTPGDVFGAILEANPPEEGVRRQGLEPRTQWLSESPSQETCSVTYLDQYRAGKAPSARVQTRGTAQLKHLKRVI